MNTTTRNLRDWARATGTTVAALMDIYGYRVYDAGEGCLCVDLTPEEEAEQVAAEKRASDDAAHDTGTGAWQRA